MKFSQLGVAVLMSLMALGDADDCLKSANQQCKRVGDCKDQGGTKLDSKNCVAGTYCCQLPKSEICDPKAKQQCKRLPECMGPNQEQIGPKNCNPQYYCCQSK